MGAITFISYLGLTIYSFNAFKCITVGGQKVLEEDPELVCGTDKHHTTQILGAIGIAVYVVGYPAFMSFKAWSSVCYYCLDFVLRIYLPLPCMVALP